MKFLLLIGILAVAYLLWRAKHRAPRDDGPAAAPPLPQDMVRCPVCSVHLPRGDALAASDGQLYCSAEHRRIAGH